MGHGVYVTKFWTMSYNKKCGEFLEEPWRQLKENWTGYFCDFSLSPAPGLDASAMDGAIVAILNQRGDFEDKTMNWGR